MRPSAHSGMRTRRADLLRHCGPLNKNLLTVCYPRKRRGLEHLTAAETSTGA
jgi:hypothetical protein